MRERGRERDRERERGQERVRQGERGRERAREKVSEKVCVCGGGVGAGGDRAKAGWTILSASPWQNSAGMSPATLGAHLTQRGSSHTKGLISHKGAHLTRRVR